MNYRNKQRRVERSFGISNKLRPGDIMPPYKDVLLNFIDPLTQKATANDHLVFSIKVNDLYDPDPAVLTTGISGFNALMTFYEFYRVNRCDVYYTVANHEAFPVATGFVFSQTQLSGTIVTRQDAIDALENGIGTKSRMLQRNSGGQSVLYLNRNIECKNLLGNPSLYTGTYDFTGTATSSPADVLWVNFIIYSPTGTTLNNGVMCSITLRYQARLFGRTILNDSSLLRPALKGASESQDADLKELSEGIKSLLTKTGRGPHPT